jgi:hypothetical protein
MDVNAIQVTALVAATAVANLLTYVLRLGIKIDGRNAKVVALALTVGCVGFAMWRTGLDITWQNALPILTGAVAAGQVVFYKFLGLDALKTK